MTRSLRFLVLALSLVTFVRGYDLVKVTGTDYVVSWPAGTVPMRIKLPTGTVPSEGRTPTSVVQDAMTTWNSKLGTLAFTWTSVSTSIQNTPVGGHSSVYSTSDTDTTNEIVIDSTVDGDAFDDNTLALTAWYRVGNTFVTADIVFNSKYTWNSYNGALQNGNVMDMERVALHELGHVLGLNHPDEAGQNPGSAIMDSYVSNIYDLMPDDIAGAQVLYGAPGFVPGNDNFANAINLVQNADTAQATGTNVAATLEAGEPDPVAGTTGSRSVWWKWTAVGSGSATVSTAGSAFDTLLGVYTGASVSGLALVGSNDDEDPYVPGVDNPARRRTSKVTFPVTNGTTYYFQVEGWEGEQGPVKITVVSAAVVSIPPSIVQQPVDQSISAGIGISFYATASGTPTPSLQWQRLPFGSGTWVNLSNNGSYSGVNSPTLNVISPTAEMSGDRFRMVATNSAGSATSSAAMLTVTTIGPPPSITTQPVSQGLFVGETLTLNVVATGTGRISYQWRKNGANLADGGRVSGTIGSTLAITNVQPGDVGNYSVNVSNTSGAVDSVVAVMTIALNLTATAGVNTGMNVMWVQPNGNLWGVGATEPMGQGYGTLTTPVVFQTDVVSVSSEFNATVFLKSNGTLWGVGNNWAGAFSNGSTSSASSPVQIATGVLSASFNGSRSVFLKSDGTLWGAGYNGNGELGDGTTTNRSTAVQIASNVASATNAGSDTIFIKYDGTLWGVGSNQLGQLYLGMPVPNKQLTPVQIASGVIAAFGGNGNQIMYIKSDRTLWGLGYNNRGQVGDGTASPRGVAAQIASNVASVSCGSSHTLFIKTDGTLWGMGSNDSGELGDGTGVDRLSPVLIASNVASAWAGNGSSSFVKTDGSFWVFGGNAAYPVGDGTLASRKVPAQITRGQLTPPAAPVGLTATVLSSADAIRLSWFPTIGAMSYEVWRSTTNSIGAASLIASNVSVSLFYDRTAAKGTAYYYWIKAVNSAGSTIAASSAFGVISLPGADFNNDRQTDVIWQNSATGQTALWLMNGISSGFTPAYVVNLGFVDPAWVIAGAGDFNHDGQADILWQNTATGQRALWLMTGPEGGFAPSYVVNLGVVDMTWQMAGTGDFNHDGQTDILWQNTATGQRALWLMTGAEGGFQPSYVVNLGVVDTTWDMAGTGDFNNDGQADILWQNTVTGQRSLWLMTGAEGGFQPANIVDLGTVDTAWVIAGTGDFNNDTQTDILWQNTATGQRALWLMNGISSGFTPANIVNLGIVDPNWVIAN